MYENRPKIDMPRTGMQKAMNIIGYSVFLGCVVYAIIMFGKLPDEVPTHFNINGEADGWGSKYTMIVVPLIALVVCLPLEALEKRPHLHNYPAFFNEENAEKLYSISMRTLNFVKNGTLLLFGLILVEMVLAANQNSFGFRMWSIIVVLALLFVPIVWHLYSLQQVKKGKI